MISRAPIPAKPGQPARHDYEYERNGVANLFMVFAPLEGWRHVKVRAPRSRSSVIAARRLTISLRRALRRAAVGSYRAFSVATACRKTHPIVPRSRRALSRLMVFSTRLSLRVGQRGSQARDHRTGLLKLSLP
jgi:hypothetical protein